MPVLSNSVAASRLCLFSFKLIKIEYDSKCSSSVMLATLQVLCNHMQLVVTM